MRRSVSGWRFELERALMRGTLRVLGWFLTLAFRLAFWLSVALIRLFARLFLNLLLPLALGLTNLMIERISHAWEKNGWFGLGLLPAIEWWQYGLVGGGIWSLAIIVSMGLAMHPFRLDSETLLLPTLAFGLGVVVGILAYSRAGQEMTGIDPEAEESSLSHIS